MLNSCVFTVSASPKLSSTETLIPGLRLVRTADMTPEELLWQLREAPEDVELEEAYYQQQMEDFSEAKTAEAQFIQILTGYDMPVTAYNILAAKPLSTDFSQKSLLPVAPALQSLRRPSYQSDSASDKAYQTDCAKEALKFATPEGMQQAQAQKAVEDMTPEELLWQLREAPLRRPSYQSDSASDKCRYNYPVLLL